MLAARARADVAGSAEVVSMTSTDNASATARKSVVFPDPDKPVMKYSDRTAAVSDPNQIDGFVRAIRARHA